LNIGGERIQITNSTYGDVIDACESLERAILPLVTLDEQKRNRMLTLVRQTVRLARLDQVFQDVFESLISAFSDLPDSDRPALLQSFGARKTPLMQALRRAVEETKGDAQFERAN